MSQGMVYDGPGQRLQRDDVVRAFPDTSFNDALETVQQHGDDFVARQASTFHDVSEGDVLLTEMFALDRTYLGFEVILRMILVAQFRTCRDERSEIDRVSSNDQ